MKIIVTIIIIILSIFVPFYSNAEETINNEELINALPENVQDYFNENEISPDNSGVLGITPESIFDMLWNSFKNEVTKPLKMLCILVGIIILTAVVEALRDSTSSSSVTTFQLVGVLAGAGMMISYISECITMSNQTLSGISTFMLSFIPAFAGIIAINGQITTATVFNSLLIVATQLFSQLSVIVLMPLASCILGVSVAGAVNPDLNMQKLSETIRKVIIWALGLLITVFVGLLSIQSFVTSSADSVTMKAAKFAVSSAVPIVGGAISDALSTVKGSMGLLRSSLGTFGVMAGISIMLPTLISVICYKFSIMIAAMVSELFGVSKLTSLLKSSENVLSIVIAILFCFALLVIISTALMMFMGLGVNI